jgi:hypothetical protein
LNTEIGSLIKEAGHLKENPTRMPGFSADAAIPQAKKEIACAL